MDADAWQRPGSGQQNLDALVAATAARDPRWPRAVDTAQRLLGPSAATRTLISQVGALYVLAIADSTGVAPEQVSERQLRHELRALLGELP